MSGLSREVCFAGGGRLEVEDDACLQREMGRDDTWRWREYEGQGERRKWGIEGGISLVDNIFSRWHGLYNILHRTHEGRSPEDPQSPLGHV